MLDIDVEKLAVRLPRELDDFEKERAVLLIEDAIAEVDDAIRDHGAEPRDWLVGSNLRRAQRVVRAMVAYAVLVGEDVGKASWSVATGPYNESVSYNSSVGPVSLWGEVELTEQMLAYLRLTSAPVVFEAPPHDKWPEVRRWSL